jgi:hypothetical protein
MQVAKRSQLAAVNHRKASGSGGGFGMSGKWGRRDCSGEGGGRLRSNYLYQSRIRLGRSNRVACQKELGVRVQRASNYMRWRVRCPRTAIVCSESGFKVSFMSLARAGACDVGKELPRSMQFREGELITLVV